MVKGLRIGIDFDNTLVSYDKLFKQIIKSKKWPLAKGEATKEQLKKVLLSSEPNDLKWQEIQSMAYGTEHMLKAKSFDGALECIKFLKRSGCEVYIVSHKSKKSHFDESKDLHEFAKKWIKENNIHKVISLKNIFFEETLEKKNNRIKEINCHFFIDDLEKVFKHPSFPSSCIPILFSKNKMDSLVTLTNWNLITHYFESLFTIDCRTFKALLKSELKYIRPLNIKGNNRVFLLMSKAHLKTVLKVFATSDKKGREVSALKYYANEESLNAPHLIDELKGHPALIMEYVGEHKSDSSYEVEKVAGPILALEHKNINELNWAKDARTSLVDYFLSIEKRLLALDKNLFKHAPTLHHKIINLKEVILNLVLLESNDLSLDLRKKFSADQLIPSPSDFGLHNMLFDKENLHFIDFEFFGKDDPVKLWLDFLYHEGFSLPKDKRSEIVSYYLKNSKIEGLKQRFNLVQPLIQFEWILIVLNALNTEQQKRRSKLFPHLDIESLSRSRLQRATQMLNSLSKELINYGTKEL